MKHVAEFRDPETAGRLLAHIRRRSTRPTRLMEFCGGHTAAIFKAGLRQLLPDTIEMLSGPGCPVCVTAGRDLDKAIALGNLPGVTVASFGDMLRVPGSRASLQQARSEGADVRVVYSAQDAVNLARNNPDREVVFIGIGFETTAPTIAASVLQAERDGIDNYTVLSLHKTAPPIMKAILDLGEVNLSGIVCPGHVSAIIGTRPYEFIPRDYGIACAVSGFEPVDILLAVARLVDQVENNTPKVENAYPRGVRAEGNAAALRLMATVFEPGDAVWRGIGAVPGSGLVFRKRYARYDAERRFEIDPGPTVEPDGCSCNRILRGVGTPPDCPLFRVVCTPQRPVGPCMVSSEGACATYYEYADGA
jgi:hydrogenase expression/formation protein HypD